MVSHFQQLDASSVNWSTSPVILAILGCQGRGKGWGGGVGVLGYNSERREGGGGVLVVVLLVVVMVVVLLLF